MTPLGTGYPWCSCINPVNSPGMCGCASLEHMLAINPQRNFISCDPDMLLEDTCVALNRNVDLCASFGDEKVCLLAL